MRSEKRRHTERAVVGVVNIAHDNPGEFIDHYHVEPPAPYHGDTADHWLDDSASLYASVTDSDGDDGDDRWDRATAAFASTPSGSVSMNEQREEMRPFPKWIGVLGFFIAPTTVITSLCYFYGYVATRSYFSYFGIDTDAIGFTTGDYVMKSLSALYVPLVMGLLVWVATLWGSEHLRRLVSSGKSPRLFACWRGPRWLSAPSAF